jgi:hypothetical protein
MTDLSSTIEIYDHEVLEIDKGPVRWMTQKQGTTMSLESFRRAVVEQFEDIGFRATVKTYETTERGTFAFDVEINGRCERKAFDYDQMVHEVTSNLLNDPAEPTGFINTREAAARVKDANPGSLKGHGPGCVHG